MRIRIPLLSGIMLASILPGAPAQERGITVPSSNGRRMALIIGNDTYPSMPLHNARNDARAMQKALTDSGFVTDLVEDAGRAAFARAVDSFAAKLQRGDVALFYYAGHGMAIDEANYLLPVDFNAQSQADVEFQSYPARQVQRKMEERGTKLNIIVLDACRNNPFHFGRSAGGGLAAMREGEGTLIAFSAKEGQQAGDNPNDANGTYTKYLVESMREPGLGIRDLFFKVQQRVFDATGGKQFPYVYAGVVGDFYFRTPAVRAESGPPSKGPAPDAEAWEAIHTSDDAELFNRFLKEYPSSQYAGAARLKLASLTRDAAGPGRSIGVPSFAAGATRINQKDGLTYVWIPPGKFNMGCSPGDNQCPAEERPAHEVEISRGFWLGQTPVTVAAVKRYRTAIGKGPLPTTDTLRTNLNEAGGNGEMPAVMMTFEEARTYCDWIGGWLPAEAEWEYAARAGTTGATYGNLDAIAWYGDNSGRQRIDSAGLATRDLLNYEKRLFENGNGPHPVKLKQPNAWNLYDMLGNVWQWTADWFDEHYYSRRETRDPRGAALGTMRVLRGAAWDNVPSWVRASFRGRMVPDFRSSTYGFRCAAN